MVVASIDIQGGKVVQLKQGTELVLKRDDAAALAKEFNVFGEVAVIDIDAAMKKHPNTEIIKSLLHLAECRVGGGIRTVEQAAELVGLGANKIIVGSAAFRSPEVSGFALNIGFLEGLAQKIGRERIIVAVDARNGEIVIDGWKTATGLNLIETSRILQKYAGELLFTCVEREGMMNGTDMEIIKDLRNAVSCLITVAGGVTTQAEIEEIALLGCDVQLGMALYSGVINLKDAFLASLNWNKGTRDWRKDGTLSEKPMLPIIAQSSDGQILMTGYADKEAVSESFDRGNVCFHSRTRDKLWMKGENSGNTMKLLKLRADCDRDALLAVVEPNGQVCHTGAWSCFETGRRYTFEYLQKIIKDRLKYAPEGSYTASLTGERVRRKVMEEAYEVCTAKNHAEIVWEVADLLYHTAVLMSKEDVMFGEILAELERRHLK